MRVTIDQRFAAPAASVASAFANPALYATYPDRGTVGRPHVVSAGRKGSQVELELHHRFTGQVSSAVRAVIDPAKLSWVERLTIDLDALTGAYSILPDHYPDRLRCSGVYQFVDDGTGARRIGSGELKVRAPLVAGAVERAIASGLQEYLDDEQGYVDAFLAPTGPT